MAKSLLKTTINSSKSPKTKKKFSIFVRRSALIRHQGDFFIFNQINLQIVKSFWILKSYKSSFERTNMWYQSAGSQFNGPPGCFTPLDFYEYESSIPKTKTTAKNNAKRVWNHSAKTFHRSKYPQRETTAAFCLDYFRVFGWKVTQKKLLIALRVSSLRLHSRIHDCMAL